MLTVPAGSGASQLRCAVLWFERWGDWGGVQEDDAANPPSNGAAYVRWLAPLAAPRPAAVHLVVPAQLGEAELTA